MKVYTELEKVYVVCWGSAGQDDDGNPVAFSGVHGLYTSKEAARKGLVDCKDEIYDDIVNDDFYDEEDREAMKADTHIYGSVEEEYFEIDYTIGDTPCEVHIRIDKVKITD
jgi:hypothetical protein